MALTCTRVILALWVSPFAIALVKKRFRILIGKDAYEAMRTAQIYNSYGIFEW